MSERMTPEQAVAELDSITHGDPEGAHGEGDDILLAVVPDEVREAYNRLRARVGGFWYA